MMYYIWLLVIKYTVLMIITYRLYWLMCIMDKPLVFVFIENERN
jgi:hypothetical protein